ncbi:hypothetical protein Cgig2_011747 [Carnegiea gigantea]|uniref:Uncharacterized protein n=1 Tax=Carnegiea gigantea TaxID=171969 RepID=A0A9Q1KJM5_9CARY|nr:hypothetical protein Cgig2_011747 [Carnegiea gigantea]
MLSADPPPPPVKPPDLFLVLHAANLPSLSQLVHISTLDYPFCRITSHRSLILTSIMMNSTSPSHNPSHIQGFLIACHSQRYRSRARELHAISLFPGFSGFRIQYSLFTVSTPRASPLSLYCPDPRGFRLPSCRRLGSFRTSQSFSFHMEAIIKGSSLLICSTPTLIHPQLVTCRDNYGELSSELSKWRLLQRSQIEMNDYNSCSSDPFFSWVMICLCHQSMVIYADLPWMGQFELGPLSMKNQRMKLMAAGAWSKSWMCLLIAPTQEDLHWCIIISWHYICLPISWYLHNWNVQGAKKAQVLEEVKILKRTTHPYILFLLETMTNEKNTCLIIQKMGFDHFNFVLPINHSGGIWVLWNNNNCHALVLAKENRAIHMLVHDPANSKNILVSGVYGLT